MDNLIDTEKRVRRDTDNSIPVEPAEPKKPTFFEKLKNKRWTFKVKNNFTKYLTVEPLLCFYMLMIFMASLIEPYNFRKACLSVDEDIYFCDIISNYGTPNQKCITIDRHVDLYCKDTKENENATKISCGKPKSRIDFISVRPEDYRVCQLAQKTYNKLEAAGTETSIGIFAVALQFLVIMVVAVWSDKYNKRKVCLLLPLLGQLIINIIILLGAFYSTLSFEAIQTAVTFTDSLCGGMSLFLFGSFSYMIDEEIRRRLLFRVWCTCPDEIIMNSLTFGERAYITFLIFLETKFGIITGIITIYRYTPLYGIVFEYYHNDNASINLLTLSLVFNIICLLYVKVVLNEVKAHKNGTESDKSSIDAISDSQHNDDTGSKPLMTSKLKRYSKRITKALNLDILWDYVRTIFRKRTKPGRIIIILYFVIVFTKSITILDERIVLVDFEGFDEIDIIDIDGAIFVLISILLKFCKLSTVAVALLNICVPVAARGVVILLVTYWDRCECAYYYISDTGTDFYLPFRRVASCSLLLAFVDRNETRIFVIVQAIAFLPQFILYAMTSDQQADLSDVLPEIAYNNLDILLMLLCFIVFVGSGFIYYFFRKYERSEKEIFGFMTSEISNKPFNFHQDDNLDEDSGPSWQKSDIVPPAPVPVYQSTNKQIDNNQTAQSTQL